ncbi:hypothetical protein ABEF95_003555 [Exophiala dermatitidis]
MAGNDYRGSHRGDDYRVHKPYRGGRGTGNRGSHTNTHRGGGRGNHRGHRGDGRSRRNDRDDVSNRSPAAQMRRNSSLEEAVNASATTMDPVRMFQERKAATDAATAARTTMPPPPLPEHANPWGYFLRKLELREQKRAKQEKEDQAPSANTSSQDDSYLWDMPVGVPSNAPGTTSGAGSSQSATEGTTAQALVEQEQPEIIRPSPLTAGSALLQQNLRLASLPYSVQHLKSLELSMILHVTQRLSHEIGQLHSGNVPNLAEVTAFLHLSRSLRGLENETWATLDNLVTQTKDLHRSVGHTLRTENLAFLRRLLPLMQSCTDVMERASGGCIAIWQTTATLPSADDVAKDCHLRLGKLNTDFKNSLGGLRGRAERAVGDKVLIEASGLGRPEARRALSIPEWINGLEKTVTAIFAACPGPIIRRVSGLAVADKSTPLTDQEFQESACHLKALSVAILDTALPEQLMRHVKFLKSKYLASYALYQREQDRWTKLWEPVHESLLDALSIHKDRAREPFPDQQELDKHQSRMDLEAAVTSTQVDPIVPTAVPVSRHG